MGLFDGILDESAAPTVDNSPLPSNDGAGSLLPKLLMAGGLMGSALSGNDQTARMLPLFLRQQAAEALQERQKAQRTGSIEDYRKIEGALTQAYQESGGDSSKAAGIFSQAIRTMGITDPQAMKVGVMAIDKLREKGRADAQGAAFSAGEAKVDAMIPENAIIAPGTHLGLLMKTIPNYDYKRGLEVVANRQKGQTRNNKDGIEQVSSIDAQGQLRSQYSGMRINDPSKESPGGNVIRIGENGEPTMGPLASTMPPAPERPAFTPPQGSRPVPTVADDGKVSTRYESEPWQFDVARGALADDGWTPDKPGYRKAFADRVAQLITVPEGGAVYQRSAATPPPPGEAMPPGAMPAPGQPPTPAIAGPTKPVSGELGRTIVGAEQASTAMGKVRELAADPEVHPYLGTYGQFRSEVLRKAPNALLGEVPPKIITLETNLAIYSNYMLNLRSGAAVTEQEGERMKKELPQMGQQPREFAQRVEQTNKNIHDMETRIKELTLHKSQQSTGQPAAPSSQQPSLEMPPGGYAGPGRVTQPDMPQTPPKPGRVWIKAPDGVWGQWDASKAIPQGYMR